MAVLLGDQLIDHGERARDPFEREPGRAGTDGKRVVGAEYAARAGTGRREVAVRHHDTREIQR
jgi:hypothetical protein